MEPEQHGDLFFMEKLLGPGDLDTFLSTSLSE